MYIWCWCSTVDFSQRDKINFVHFVATEKEKKKKIPIPNEINVVFKKKNIEQDFIFLISCFLKPEKNLLETPPINSLFFPLIQIQSIGIIKSGVQPK
ncbi:hypothetical protein DERF_003282 [Dermatophagoides farinae]|uniref:Uncharacterized protein n=1 Tax=Dermatophagoides farinae TaxID=6954 RepID=A0A922ID94_DERFA|nr:hypothetical protein DERF_003282 [Dermatophagoides farinae]